MNLWIIIPEIDSLKEALQNQGKELEAIKLEVVNLGSQITQASKFFSFFMHKIIYYLLLLICNRFLWLGFCYPIYRIDDPRINQRARRVDRCRRSHSNLMLLHRTNGLD